MDQGVTRDHWLGLGLQEDALPAIQAGKLRLIEATGSQVVGVSGHGAITVPR